MWVGWRQRVFPALVHGSTLSGRGACGSNRRRLTACREKQPRFSHEALELPPEARAALADSLLDSLDTEIDPDAEQAWRDEIERRIMALDEGRARLVPWDEIRAGLSSRGRGGMLFLFVWRWHVEIENCKVLITVLHLYNLACLIEINIRRQVHGLSIAPNRSVRLFRKAHRHVERCL